MTKYKTHTVRQLMHANKGGIFFFSFVYQSDDDDAMQTNHLTRSVKWKNNELGLKP